jgi:hypothetical protein
MKHERKKDRTAEAAPFLNPDAWLTEHETSEELGISVRTLQGYRVKGIGPPYTKRNKLVRYQRRLNQQWALEGLRSSTSDTKPRKK